MRKKNLKKNIKNIYPEKLELKKENVGFNDATFLDLGIEIKNSPTNSMTRMMTFVSQLRECLT